MTIIAGARVGRDAQYAKRDGYHALPIPTDCIDVESPSECVAECAEAPTSRRSDSQIPVCPSCTSCTSGAQTQGVANMRAQVGVPRPAYLIYPQLWSRPLTTYLRLSVAASKCERTHVSITNIGLGPCPCAHCGEHSSHARLTCLSLYLLHRYAGSIVIGRNPRATTCGGERTRTPRAIHNRTQLGILNAPCGGRRTFPVPPARPQTSLRGRRLASRCV